MGAAATVQLRTTDESQYISKFAELYSSSPQMAERIIAEGKKLAMGSSMNVMNGGASEPVAPISISQGKFATPDDGPVPRGPLVISDVTGASVGSGDELVTPFAKKVIDTLNDVRADPRCIRPDLEAILKDITSDSPSPQNVDFSRVMIESCLEFINIAPRMQDLQMSRQLCEAASVHAKDLAAMEPHQVEGETAPRPILGHVGSDNSDVSERMERFLSCAAPPRRSLAPPNMVSQGSPVGSRTGTPTGTDGRLSAGGGGPVKRPSLAGGPAPPVSTTFPHVAESVILDQYPTKLDGEVNDAVAARAKRIVINFLLSASDVPVDPTWSRPLPSAARKSSMAKGPGAGGKGATPETVARKERQAKTADSVLTIELLLSIEHYTSCGVAFAPAKPGTLAPDGTTAAADNGTGGDISSGVGVLVMTCGRLSPPQAVTKLIVPHPPAEALAAAVAAIEEALATEKAKKSGGNSEGDGGKSLTAEEAAAAAMAVKKAGGAANNAVTDKTTLDQKLPDEIIEEHVTKLLPEEIIAILMLAPNNIKMKKFAVLALGKGKELVVLKKNGEVKLRSLDRATSVTENITMRFFASSIRVDRTRHKEA